MRSCKAPELCNWELCSKSSSSLVRNRKADSSAQLTLNRPTATQRPEETQTKSYLTQTEERIK